MNLKGLKRRLGGQRGQGMTEYIIIVGLIALLLIAAVRAYKDEVEIAIVGTDGQGGMTGSVNTNVDVSNDDSGEIGLGEEGEGGEPEPDPEPNLGGNNGNLGGNGNGGLGGNGNGNLGGNGNGNLGGGNGGNLGGGNGGNLGGGNGNLGSDDSDTIGN